MKLLTFRLTFGYEHTQSYQMLMKFQTIRYQLYGTQPLLINDDHIR